MSMLRLAVVLVSCVAVCQGITSPEHMEQLQDYLVKYGYLQTNGTWTTRSVSDVQQATRKLQNLFGLEMSGEADNATMALVNTLRCGNPDIVSADSLANFVTGPKFTEMPVTIRMWPLTEKMGGTIKVPRAIIESAMSLWTSVSGLSTEIKEIPQYLGDVDVHVSFGSKCHYFCDYPLDGPGGSFGHFKLPPEAFAHFDDDNVFSDGPSAGARDLMIYAVHGLGHAFGIGHSENPDAMMYALYRDIENVQLHSDDVEAIQSLYGAA